MRKREMRGLRALPAWMACAGLILAACPAAAAASAGVGAETENLRETEASAAGEAAETENLRETESLTEGEAAETENLRETESPASDEAAETENLRETESLAEGAASETEDLQETEKLRETEASAAAASSNLKPSGKKLTIRVCNWEEYLDLGDWDEEDTIDLDSGDIIGVNPMVSDFEEWYRDTYGIEVKVEYSTFGTNEDLYNMLTLGDVYDLVCPSEYMFMKMMDEDLLVPLSDHFFDTSDACNYYSRGVSPYIRRIFDGHEIGGEPWSKYAAGYMWGITGFVYNPDEVSRDQVSSWRLMSDPSLRRRVTIKDNVRDAYFSAVGALKHDLLTDPDFLADPDYSRRLEEEMNDTSPETIAMVQEYLQDVRDNVYSFETDSGKSDMITGKVLVNSQWSGDGVYTLDQADEDDFYLAFAVPEEATNIYFDGWVMLRAGVEGHPDRQHAAEAFINFVSRPDNVIRNMNYVGYTSVISGGDDDRIFEYADWNYGAEEDEEDVIEYPLGYFFSDDPDDPDYVITAPSDAPIRQLGSQYPSREQMDRSSIMVFFDQEQNEMINRMWINVRCMNFFDIPVWVWILTAAVAAMLFALWLRRRRRKAMY